MPKPNLVMPTACIFAAWTALPVLVVGKNEPCYDHQTFRKKKRLRIGLKEVTFGQTPSLVQKGTLSKTGKCLNPVGEISETNPSRQSVPVGTIKWLKSLVIGLGLWVKQFQMAPCGLYFHIGMMNLIREPYDSNGAMLTTERREVR